LTLTEQQIESLAPNPAAFSAGKKLSAKSNWMSLSYNDRAIWGEIKGSGKNPYQVQIELDSFAYKCNCPSRQFPCKHNIGLMLLYGQTPNTFVPSTDEPDWVKNWLDKRQNKSKKEDSAPEERSNEDQKKLDKAKEKNQNDRFESVKAGVADLELWLKDIIRIGILELPNKPQSELEKVAARMVDAKANGLAAWARSLANIKFGNENQWQSEALGLISKLFLLIKTFQNYDNLSPIWQTTIKNLVGWPQSPKELIANPDAETIKDKWLVVGQTNETDGEITTQRNWLVACHSNRKALLLYFATKFSQFEQTILPGTIIHADLCFFPSALPYRAAIKIQRGVEDKLDMPIDAFQTWKEAFAYKTEQLKLNPWASEQIIIINDARIAKYCDQWVMYDREKNFIPVAGQALSIAMKWLVQTGNRAYKTAGLLQNGMVLPLGIFQNNQYKLL